MQQGPFVMLRDVGHCLGSLLLSAFRAPLRAVPKLLGSFPLKQLKPLKNSLKSKYCLAACLYNSSGWSGIRKATGVLHSIVVNGKIVTL